MGSWIALADDEASPIRDEPDVRRVTNECREELRKLVRSASAGENVDKAPQLRSVIPKMCSAYLGLSKFADCQAEANLLAQWIGKAQQPDGSWGFLADASLGLLETTALVVRYFAREQTLSQQLRRGVAYLQKAYGSPSNSFLRLYALNTLLLHDPENTSKHKVAVKKEIAKLLNQAFFNPTQFPNPINLDFNDGTKTRYIRLPTDLILLESLELISGPRGEYVRGYPGHRIFKHVVTTLAVPPDRDTTGHRLTPPSALNLYECLTRLRNTRQLQGLLGLFGTGLAYFVCALAFGVNVGWNLISVGGTLAGVFISWWYLHDKVFFGAFLGAFLKSTLDLGKSVYNTFTRFGGE